MIQNVVEYAKTKKSASLWELLLQITPFRKCFESQLDKIDYVKYNFVPVTRLINLSMICPKQQLGMF